MYTLLFVILTSSSGSASAGNKVAMHDFGTQQECRAAGDALIALHVELYDVTIAGLKAHPYGDRYNNTSGAKWAQGMVRAQCVANTRKSDK